MRIFTTFLSLGICIYSTCFTNRLLAQNALSEPGDPETILLDGHVQRQVIRVAHQQQRVTIQNLIPGQNYLLKIPQDPHSDLCLPSMHLLGSAEQLLSYNDTLHELRFTADAETMPFQFDYVCSWNPDSPPTHYVSLLCQTCQRKTLHDFIESSVGDIVVNEGINAHALIRDVLIGGECFDISNVTYHGRPAQIGTFSNGQTNIGFSTGVIMATGNALVATGQNGTDSADMGFGDSTPDADLTELSAGGDIYDKAEIEFDFRPTQSSVSFEFVFASEEYCEYVGSPFNDAFGFFISGPGISGPFNGAQNIALVPTTTTYVAINNVNHLSNSAYFTNNTPASGTLCGQTGSLSPIVNQIQFDGFTKKITARANLQTCKTYHIKLKIADVADGIFDSAVFLKAGSFDAGSNASVHWVVDGQLNALEAYENCGAVSLLFRRVGGDLGMPLTIAYTVSGSATSGVDYSGLPNSVTIPAGQTEISIPVNILADALQENPETIQVMLTNLCNCSRPQEVLTILDVLPLQVAADTVFICAPGSATLTAQVLGGAAPYQYQWENGSNNTSIQSTVTVSQNYRVTVTDRCGATGVATARVSVIPPVTAQLQSPAPELCFGQADSLTILLQGLPPFSLTYTLNGIPQPPITNILGSPFKLLVSQPGIYALTSVSSSGGCVGTALGSLVVNTAVINVNSTLSQVSCAGLSNGAITPAVQGGLAPYNYTWSGPQPIPPNTNPATNLQTGTYFLTVADALGCKTVKQYSITAPPVLQTVVAGTQGTDCDSPNVGSINLEVSGGTPTYSYSWSNMSSNQDPQSLSAGTYTVTVTDQSGCTAAATAVVSGNFTAPLAHAATTGNLSCVTQQIELDGTGSSFGSAYSYQWTASNGGHIVSDANSLFPVIDSTGTYTLLVINNINGCTTTATVQQNSIIDQPVVNAGPDEELNCNTSQIHLNAMGTSQGTALVYQWTADNGGSILADGNTLQPLVGSAGTFILLVTNNNNGCSNSDTVSVLSNTNPPVTSVAFPDSLTCSITEITLLGSAMPTTDVSFQWMTMDGTIQSGQNTSIAVVTEAGLYTLIATNTLNGCADSISVSVEQNYNEPLALVIPSAALDCAHPSIILDGESSIYTANTTFVWSATNGGNFLNGINTLSPEVNAAGTYTLVLTNNISNCSSTASILIGSDEVLPPAVAGNPGELTCIIQSLVLGDNSAVSTYAYNWTATNGGNITPPNNASTLLVDTPGTYILSVTNPVNGCVTIDSVMIDRDTMPPLAVASPNDTLDCTNQTLQLSGAGSSTGPEFSYQWTSSTGNGIAFGSHSLAPTVTLPATYTLQVTNISSGCKATAATVVTSSAEIPDATALPVSMLNCVDETILIDGTGSSVGPGINYVWSSSDGPIQAGQGTLQATVSEPGLYTLLVSNTNNACSSSYTVEVEQDITAPQANAGPGQTLLCILPSLLLHGTGSSTGSNITYQWTALQAGNFISATNLLNPTINAPGLYQIEVTNLDNGCKALDQVQIGTDPTAPFVQIDTPGILNCAEDQITLNASTSSNGNNFSYAWTGPGLVAGANTPVLQVDAAGDYLLEITNTNNGCKASDSVSVAQDTLAPPAFAGMDAMLNCLIEQAQLGTPTAPGGSLTYMWTGPSIVSGGNSALATVDSAGIYNLVVTDPANGCSTTDAVQILEDVAVPQAEAGDPFELSCASSSYVLNASASVGNEISYLWSTDTGNFLSPLDTLTPTVNAAGTYTLTVTNMANGCSSIDTVFINQSNDVPLAVIAAPTMITCSAATVELDGSASSQGFSYIYNWTVQDGGNIIDGANTLTPIVNNSGTYILEVTNTSNNCVVTSSVNVLENTNLPEIVVDSGAVITCTTPILRLHSTVLSPGTFAYQWLAEDGGFIVGGAFTSMPLITSAGTYIVYVLNLETGCLNAVSTPVLANQDVPDVVIPHPDLLTCVNGEVTLNLNSSVSTLELEWTTINGHFTNLDNPVQVQVDQPGVYEVVVTNTENGCVSYAAVQVLQGDQAPIAEAGSTAELSCKTTFANLNGTGSSQGSQYSYHWTTMDGQILQGDTSLAPLIGSGGTYQLVVVNNDNGCMSSDAVVVGTDTILPTIVIPDPAVLTCLQTEVPVLSNVSSGTGSNSFSYQWTTDNGLIVNGMQAESIVAGATGDYFLEVTNLQNGCSNTDTATVTANIELPEADAGLPKKLSCSVKEVELQGLASSGAGYSYAWSTQGGQILSGAQTLQPIVGQPGAYTLTVFNQNNGCEKTDMVEVLQETNVPTDFIVGIDPPSCKGDNGLIHFEEVVGGVGPYVYSIDDGQIFTTIQEFEDISPGVYDLTIRDSNGCVFNKTLNVPQAMFPNVSIFPEISIELGGSAELQAVVTSYPYSLIDTVIWSPTEGLQFNGNTVFDLLHPIATPFESIDYTVTVISVDGCSATDRVSVQVDDEPHIYIPNAFSPWNNDNKNDIVLIFANSSQIRTIRHFSIYDRWGEKVFQAENFAPNDPAFGWNGRFRGVLLDPAVFVYKAEIEIINGDIILKSGDITLVR